MFLNEVIGSGAFVFVGLYQRNPHGTSFLIDLYRWVYLLDLQHIGPRLNSAHGAQHPHLSGAGHSTDSLHTGPDHPKYPSVGGQKRQIPLLNISERLGRSSVARKNDQRTACIEEMLHALQCVAIHRFKRPWSIGSAGIVAHIKVIIPGEKRQQLLKNGKPSVAGIKNADHSLGIKQVSRSVIRERLTV